MENKTETEKLKTFQKVKNFNFKKFEHFSNFCGQKHIFGAVWIAETMKCFHKLSDLN